MAVVTTTTYLEALRYPSESMIERSTDGMLWMLKRISATQFALFISIDDGANWSIFSSTEVNRPNLQEMSGLFIDSENNVHIAYRVHEFGQDRIYYRRLQYFENDWDIERMIANTTSASPGGVYTGISVAAFKLSTTWYIFFAVGTRNGTNSGVTLFAGTINSSNAWALKNTLISGYRVWLNGPDGAVHPSIDFKHPGDAKSVGSGPALWVAWGRATQYCIKASWTSGPNWYGPWTPTTISTGLTNQDYTVGRYNGYGDKFNVLRPNGSTVTVIERKVDDSGATQRSTPIHPQGVVRHFALSNNANNNNYRIYAVGTSTPDLYFTDYNSIGGTWSDWTLVTATDVTGTNPNNFSVRRNNYGNGQFDLVIQGGASPYTLTHTSSVAPSPPRTPTITSPANGAAADVNAVLTINWQFSHDNPLATQSAYALKRNISGIVTYWNNGTNTWQGSEVFNTSGTSSKTFPAGWGTDSDSPHSYSVRVVDNTGAQSQSYSPTVQIVPTTQTNPVITFPVNTVTSPTLTATWTVASQSAYRVELETNDVIVASTGWVSSVNQSVPVDYTLKNGQAYTVRLTTRNAEGLESATITKSFGVVFTPPAVPTAVVLAPDPDEGGILISVTNALPVGFVPAVESQSLFRRRVGDTSEGVKVATGMPNNGSYFDFTVASGIEYEYAVLLYGNNGTTRLTDWIS